MNNLARLSSLVAALCLAVPATGFSNDHDHGGGGGSWHGGGGGSYYHGGGSYYHGGGHGYYSHGHYYGYGPHVHFYGYGGFYPFYYPSYGAPYYDGGYAADAYYDGPDGDAPAPTYRGHVDDRGDNLAVDVQRALRHDGYYHGGIDGDIGAGTRAAIRQYQYDHSLEVTGRIDKALLRSMGLD